MNIENTKLTSYEAFEALVQKLGFMPFSKNCLDYISVDGETGLTTPEQWHTGLADDPWQWRIQIEQQKRAAYGKLFDKKPGFIALEWYPYFLALRRKNRSFEEIYSDGLLSSSSKLIYELFQTHEQLATHEIKALCGFNKETVSKYESSMAELQMWMFITSNGTKRKADKFGEPYGWPSITYSTVEAWAGPELITEASNISYKAAYDKIIARINEIIPDPPQNKLKRFIGI